jgi:hypothetical protein
MICSLAMLGIYYGNVWGARSLPFMSTKLLTDDGSKYPTSKVFINGVLDTEALATYGVPKLSGTFAYAMLMSNAAVSGNIQAALLTLSVELTVSRSVL